MKAFIEELRTVDWRDPGRWPMAVHALVVALCFVLLSTLCIWYFVLQTKQPQLQQLQDQEQTLRADLRAKHSMAINLSVYEQQLKDIERSFGAMLQQLPSKTQVDSLLVDIAQTAVAAALDVKLFEPQAEVKYDFYAEKPIKIKLAGSYHQFGAFVSGIAALGRIVTLHGVEITPAAATTSYDNLQMELTAKTYRYLDDEEVKTAESEKRKAAAPAAASAAAAKNGGA
jgi:type IV pilus assembly protein PilO